MRATYDARPASFTDIGALVAACDLEHRAQLDALVDQMPEDPDAVWRMFDDSGYGLQIEEVARCCRARWALEASMMVAASGRKWRTIETDDTVREDGFQRAAITFLQSRDRLSGLPYPARPRVGV
jgi:hypothetical protein